MIVWALFDSGNGCYTQGAELFNQSVSRSVSQSVSRSVGQSVSRSVGQSVSRSVGQSKYTLSA